MEEQELIREAMRVIGSKTSERKAVSSRANGAKAREVVTSEEHKAKLRAAQQARRDREKAEREPMRTAEAATKRPPGRPRKEQPEAIEPKRPRGRPKKETVQNG